MIVTHSILQILDLKSGSHSFSETELDLSSDTTIDYILKYIIILYQVHQEERVSLQMIQRLKKTC